MLGVGMQSLDTDAKLSLLGAASSYDVCAASHLNRRLRRSNTPDQKSKLPGVYRAYLPNGGCISLFKVLLTNECINDCAYCVNHPARDQRRSAFTPEELAATFIEFEQRGHVTGLFLSSGIADSAARTMEQMLKAVEILRHNYRFHGYIHLKILPGSPHQYVERACRLADRVSINVEAPTPQHLAMLSSGKDLVKNIIESMGWIKDIAREPGVLKGGQTTQFVVGAANESDRDIFHRASQLYEDIGIRRSYYSAFQPIPHTPLEEHPPAPALREHHLYQVDWLYRIYDYSTGELEYAFAYDGNLQLGADPKLTIALQTPWRYPVDINTASYHELLRVPGIGPVSARRITQARHLHSVDSLADLRKMGVVIGRASPFIHFPGHRRKAIQAPLPLAIA